MMKKTIALTWVMKKQMAPVAFATTVILMQHSSHAITGPALAA